jgi:TolC family type I secretion outer membrane protein
MIKKFMLVILLSLACFLSAVPFSWAGLESSSSSESSTPLKKKKKSKKKTKKKKKVASKKKKLKAKKSSKKAKRPSQKRAKQPRFSLPPEDETPSLMASLEDSATATNDSLPPPPEEEPSEAAAEPEPTATEAEVATPDAPADELDGGITLMEKSSPESTDTSADANLPTPSEIMTETEVAPITGKDPEKAIVLEKEPAPTSENEQVISIEDAMVGAYQQSDLIGSEYHVKASQLKLAHAQRGWLPVTNANLGYSYNSTSVTQKNSIRNAPGMTPTSITDSAGPSAGVSLKQNLYQGGSTIASILAHRKGLDASFAEYLSKEKEVLKKAITAYITLFVRQQAFRLNQANQKLLEETLEVNKNRYEFGELTRYDVASAQAKLDKAKSEVIGAFAEVEKAKAIFLKETGVSPSQTLQKVPFPTQLLPKSKKEAMEIAIKMSPELKNMSAKADQAAARADAALGNFLPSLDVNVSASRSLMDMWNKQNYYGGKGKEEDSKWGAGATLTIPLDFAGSAQTSIRAEKYEAAQARLIALYARRDVLSLTSQAWDAMEAAKARIDQLKSQVDAAKIAVEVVREEFLAGTKTTLEVLSAEQESFSAQVSLIEAEQQEIMTAYDLLYRIGILSAEALSLNVTIYTPDKEKVSFWGLNIDHDPRLAQQEALDMNMTPWEKSL